MSAQRDYQFVNRLPIPAKQVFHIDPERHNPKTVSRAPLPDAYAISHKTLQRYWHLFVEIIATYAYQWYLDQKAQFTIHAPVNFAQRFGPIPDFVVDVKNSPYVNILLQSSTLTHYRQHSVGNTVATIVERSEYQEVIENPYHSSDCQQEYDKLIQCYRRHYEIVYDAYIGLWFYAVQVVTDSLYTLYRYYLLREAQTDKQVQQAISAYRKQFDTVYRETVDWLHYLAKGQLQGMDDGYVNTKYLYNWMRTLLDAMKPYAQQVLILG